MQDEGINIGEHALNSMFKKGFSMGQVEEAYKNGFNYWDMRHNNLNKIYNGVRIIIDPKINKIENILDIKSIDPQRFIKLSE